MSKDSLWIIQQKRTSATKYEIDRLIAETPDTFKPEVVLHPSVDIIVDREDRRSIRWKNQVVDLPKIIIPRTGSGTGYFGFAILRHFERLGIPTVNKSYAIEATKDKLFAHQVLAEHGIPTPKTMLVKHPVNSKLVDKVIGWPAVVKIMAGSYGKGVYIVSSREKFHDFIEFAHGIKSDEAIIVQEYIAEQPGTDLRVFVIGDKVLGAIKRSSTDGSFKANLTRGGVGEVYPVTDQIEKIALDTARALDLEVAGVDLLFDKDGGYKVCEANSAPGFQGFEKATGINVAQEIVSYAISKL